MPTRPPPDDALKTYRAKRSADRTPEPSGSVAAAPGRRFIVHQHAATRLHFDLRLEMDGVLKSWAVPKGPSRDPADKRLAVHVEDHPIEYGDFEGIIPEGNYGAGAVIVWDRGVWVPLEDPAAGLAKGKLLFELRGYKLRGVWTLVKIKKSVKDWLLIKERDAYTATNGAAFPPGSVLSGLTVEELRDGSKKPALLVAELKKLKAPLRAVRAEDVAPMLAETREEPFSRAGWVFEVKLDGYRMRAVKEGGSARLITRNGNDYSAAFPELIRPIAALPYSSLIMDGELVILDEQGRPSFQRLQNRARIGRAPDIRHASVETPGTLYVFDLMAVEGFDLRSLPLVKRKALLRKVLPEAGPLRYSEHFEKDGEALYDRAVGMGLEGIVAKKADAPYKSGRSDLWLKIRADKTGDFVVVGYTAPKGSRGGFGALHLGGYADGKLVYAGRAGSGFTGQMLKQVGDQLLARETPRPPFEGPVPAEQESHWVKPELVAEVRYKEVTGDGLLRQPVFLRFRDDKKPAECVIERRGEWSVVDAGARPEEPPTTHHAVQFTNLDKVFWPDERYTKGDLIEYYRAVSSWMLRYLADRPLVLTRFPDGINGKSFFQKDAPAYAQAFVRTVTIWSEDSQRELDYFVCDNEASLLYIANMAAILLHIWSSRVDTLETPDWCILDLDPKEAPFTDVVTVAQAVKALCDDIGLPAGIKTSGSTGLHVLIPLGRQVTYAQSRTLGGLLARVIAAQLPDIATVTRQVQKRGGKVYLDYVQNGHGRLLVAPFSARPLPGAPVSTPLEWREVTPKLDIRAFTIRTVPARMQQRKDDPLWPVLDLEPDLMAALARLQSRLDE
ncbi:MAG TPA: DNA ligase D [Gemmatimonadales bacterium]|jgi:bifunctional non-homologous end joining protein LigD